MGEVQAAWFKSIADTVLQMSRDHGKHLREGQIVFNAASRHEAKLVQELSGTEFDCFYDDSKTEDFIMELWRRKFGRPTEEALLGGTCHCGDSLPRRTAQDLDIQPTLVGQCADCAATRCDAPDFFSRGCPKKRVRRASKEV